MKSKSMLMLVITIFWGVGLGWASDATGQTLQLVTENYPPFNMSLDGVDSAANEHITGISTDIVRELFKRVEIDYTLALYPWQRAYWMAQNKKNTGVFSTTRTQERDALFKWVGPLVKNNWVFLAKKGKKIKIQSLEDAKKYRIGGYEGDAVALYLESLGFTLELTVADQYNALLIEKDRIDLWATGHLLGPYYAKKQGLTNLEEVFMFKETIMSIAFNHSASDTLIAQLNRALQTMREDGTIESINQRYR